MKAFQTRLQVDSDGIGTGREILRGCGFEKGKKMGRLVAGGLESSKEEFDDFGLGIRAFGVDDFPCRKADNPVDTG